MSGTRWLSPVVIAALALGGCADQEGEQAETGLQADTMQADTMAAGEQMSPAVDTASTDLATWNTDADARLGPEEFDGWLEEQDFYGEWNTDGAEGLTPGEFAAGLFAVLDANDDGTIGSTEWSDAGAGWTGDAALADWDGDGDGALGEDELASGLQGSELWSEWDADGNGRLSRAEFNAAVFGAWDANDDDYVDETEWGASFDRWS